jgi:hypothetical protein
MDQVTGEWNLRDLTTVIQEHLDWKIIGEALRHPNLREGSKSIYCP